DVARLAARLDALVVVVDRDGQDLLGALLADDVLIEDGLDLGGLREAAELARLLLFPLLRDDVVTELDALVADVDGGPGDQLADLPLRLAAERAGQVDVLLLLQVPASDLRASLTRSYPRPFENIGPCLTARKPSPERRPRHAS